MDLNIHITMPELTQAVTALAVALNAQPPKSAQAEAAVPAPPQPAAPPAPAVPPVPTPTAIPTAAAPAYTLDQIMQAAAGAAEAREAIVQLMNDKYQIQQLQQLPPEQYGAFATDIRALGAKI